MKTNSLCKLPLFSLLFVAAVGVSVFHPAPANADDECNDPNACGGDIVKLPTEWIPPAEQPVVIALNVPKDDAQYGINRDGNLDRLEWDTDGDGLMDTRKDREYYVAEDKKNMIQDTLKDADGTTTLYVYENTDTSDDKEIPR